MNHKLASGWIFSWSQGLLVKQIYVQLFWANWPVWEFWKMLLNLDALVEFHQANQFSLWQKFFCFVLWQTAGIWSCRSRSQLYCFNMLWPELNWSYLVEIQILVQTSRAPLHQAAWWQVCQDRCQKHKCLDPKADAAGRAGSVQKITQQKVTNEGRGQNQGVRTQQANKSKKRLGWNTEEEFRKIGEKPGEVWYKAILRGGAG